MVQKNLKPQLIFIYSDDCAINATKYKNNNHIEKEAGEPLQIHSTKEAARVGKRPSEIFPQLTSTAMHYSVQSMYKFKAESPLS